MKIKELIEKKYGSIDIMIKQTGTNLSRTYLYSICSGLKYNISLDIAEELVRILELKSIDQLKELLDESKKV